MPKVIAREQSDHGNLHINVVRHEIATVRFTYLTMTIFLRTFAVKKFINKEENYG